MTREQGKLLHVHNRAVLDAAAGAFAGCIARFVVGPLDVLKIRFQVQLEPVKAGHGGRFVSKYTGIRQAVQTIVREEGIQGLWRGTLPGQLLYVPYAAVQFVTLQQCKLFARKHGLWEGSLTSFVSGAIAGVAATVASYPFDVLRTTLAAQGEPRVYKGMVAAARGIVAERGVQGLYRGLGVTLVEIVPYSALQFGLYDTFNVLYMQAKRRRHLQAGGDPAQLQQRNAFQEFLCGLAAGTLAKLATHPLDVAKKRFQIAGLQRSTLYGQRITRETMRSLPACLGEMYRREGLAGLYKGAGPSIMKAAPAAAITFVSYEAIMRRLLAVVDVNHC